MDDKHNEAQTPRQGEIVLTPVPDTVEDEAGNVTPTDLLARLHQREDSRIEPDNENG